MHPSTQAPKKSSSPTRAEVEALLVYGTPVSISITTLPGVAGGTKHILRILAETGGISVQQLAPLVPSATDHLLAKLAVLVTGGYVRALPGGRYVLTDHTQWAHVRAAQNGGTR